MEHSLPPVAWIGSVAVAAVAAATDLRSGRIPNTLTYPALVAGPLWHGVTHGELGLLAALLGIVAGGLGPVLLHRRGVMGGGDAKLFGALGGLIGMQAALEVQWVSLALVGVYALVAAARRGQLRATLEVLVRRQLGRRDAGAAPDLPPGFPGEARLGGAVLLACLIVGFDPAHGFLP